VYPSTHNLIIPLAEKNDHYLLINALSGSVDLARGEEVFRLQTIDVNRAAVPDEFVEYLLSRGYLYADQQAEEAALQEAYARFNQEMQTSPVQLFFIPTYGCDLACNYCYQRNYRQGGIADFRIVDAFYEDVIRRFAAEKVPPFVTLFGGEPLGPGAKQREIVDYFISRANEYQLEVAVVTNGYHLESYLDVLQKGRLREIQVTVDGPEEVHDRRRPAGSGAGTYSRIMQGIDGAIKRGFPVNLRVVLDKENLEHLPRLVREIKQRGWLKLEPERFKTQLGRNYELYSCDRQPGRLLERVGFWQEIAALGRKFPEIWDFHQPELAGIRQLATTGELPLPGFDTCPAGKKEWVYDYLGHIYGCTATAGREEYRLGSFYPTQEIDPDQLLPWQERSILTIPKCRECKVSLLCGGGCGVIAAQKNQGNVLSPDCRPVEEWWQLGTDIYRSQLERLLEGEDSA